MKPKRVRHIMRVNPHTHDYEFAFLFDHNPTEPLGWWGIDQVKIAVQQAIDTVTAKEFDAVIAREFPQYTRSEDVP